MENKYKHTCPQCSGDATICECKCMCCDEAIIECCYFGNCFYCKDGIKVTALCEDCGGCYKCCEHSERDYYQEEKDRKLTEDQE